MKSVVATVSGYHGLDRFNLIKLISHAGASYVGSLSRSTTLLVCWRFEGKKYELAMTLNTIIVNHRWVEDCIKEGKRLPEDPYMLQSGEEIGPLLLKIPDVPKGASLTKKCKPFSDISNIHHELRNEASDVGYGGFGLSGRFKSALLYEQGESSSYASVPPMRNKRKLTKKKDPIANCSTQLVRKEANIPNLSRDTCLAESSKRKGRRLVKNVNRGAVVSDLSDSDQDCHRVHKQYDGVPYPSGHSLDRTASLSEIGGLSNCKFNKHRGVDEDIEEVEEIKLWKYHPCSEDSAFARKDAPSVSERTSPDGCSDAEKEGPDVGQTELASRLPSPVGLSCVICLTEFSSTRGVLPCGHRFCYSCIQDWADHTTSRGKISTCPLCKASFMSITKVEDVPISDQKIFSQTIPCATSTIDVYILPEEERPGFGAQSSSASVCIKCRCREPEDLLVSCHLCQIRNIHRYCLDPPLFPWTCIHCKDLGRLRTNSNYGNYYSSLF